MSSLDLHRYDKQATCTYKGESYQVRDNGAVYRFRKNDSVKRPLDEAWTFGNLNKGRGYYYFSSEPVHRIVATAFHGKSIGERNVVDHIDTNRLNNRPENLRWVTRLENSLNNPITLKRILIAYGSIENFKANPSMPLAGKLETNLDWMRTVSREEAENSLRNLLDWARRDIKMPKEGQLGDWVYSRLEKNQEDVISETSRIRQSSNQEDQQSDEPVLENSPAEEGFFPSLSSQALQRFWKTPTEFPNCPESLEGNPLETYRDSLTEGAVFSRNAYGTTIVVSAEISKKSNRLIVASTMQGIKPWAMAEVYIEHEKFVHESSGSFFTENGLNKYFTLAQGLEWEGEDSIDDYS